MEKGKTQKKKRKIEEEEEVPQVLNYLNKKQSKIEIPKHGWINLEVRRILEHSSFN